MDASRPKVRGIVLDIALNAGIPFALFELSKRYISSSELVALALATTYPALRSLFSLTRSRKFDPVSLVVLAGIATSVLVLVIGGGPRILLIRESLFTGIFGVVCFVSLLFPRPIMFYFGRYFMSGGDRQKGARFDTSWQLPELRFGHRLITTVWGVVYVGEFLARVIMVYTLPAALVLLISPILMGSATLLTIIWTFRYGRRLGESARSAFVQRLAPAAPPQ
jgi:hypothetical protein